MSSNTLQKFQSLHYRRTLLEALAQLSCQLHSASEGLAAVQQIVRPSQHYTPALRERLANEINFYSTQDEQKLRETLVVLNGNLEKASTLFLRIAKLDDNAFIQNFQADEEHREKFRLLQNKVNGFQKQTQHYLAIRIVLQDRGNQLEIIKLTLEQGVLDQELLAEELDRVRTREKLHKKRFRNEVSGMLTDTELLITVAKNNKEVFTVLMLNAEHLQSVLDILDSGGDIQLIPDVIESINCDLLPDSVYEHMEPIVEPDTDDQQATTPAVFVQTASTQKASAKKAPAKKSVEKSLVKESAAPVDVPTQTAKANNFFVRLRLWMSTSWNVTWAETKYYRR